ncbi:aminotransferase class I/II-fold pyridoxal phosphate-dependent enzyme [Oscillatoria salina]|uniref:aminotransferase class I/II-fold pyridoxal phosphate-dependent enzyme n=1 Tax=Oscillatoria salina TaxID=331517 RepID=UPI0013B90200|nr:aminotransferase class I/II-fold pyridoxal phosphate-dependent enzyme [Oscillatoria salina]MBZ8181243.1 aminotransferase class I/II-fold pyridoxal phosphate-dependent enzyme [Oscillatoria salina IIICB1]NET91078.1 aminotransferase class I/II-fold pyridoxal phosphate-dependent enzyme [Kamptonema sp. SIO1D9]
MPEAKQSKTPILAKLRELANKPHAAFYAPGHKRGQGISQPLAELVGKAVFQADLPELPELDNLFAPEGVIAEAQALAAEAFGASQTWFLVNGSTCGVMAAILATCGAGDKIILPRNIHQSAIAALILSGAVPIFINPEYDPTTDLALSIAPEALEAILNEHPETKAVMMVYPTYHGICGDVRAIATLCHQYHIPLLVDEAHGAHFAFHPELPISALAAGADLAVQSTHKILGAMTQASMLHLKSNLIDAQKISKALQLLQSTSPNYLLLASLDAARQQMALFGQELMSKTLSLADDARKHLKQLENLAIVEPIKQAKLGFETLDKTRLTVLVTQLGLTGFETDEILHKKLGVTAELPMQKHLTFIISLGNTATDIDKLVQGFTTLSKEYQGKENQTVFIPEFPQTKLAMSPREAYFATKKSLPIAETIGCISAETICPYPPGIPVLMPGEIITVSAINYLETVVESGGNITGCSDSSLKKVSIVFV